MKPVGILGLGRTGYAPKPGVAIPEMVHQAVQGALNDAGLIIDEIDAAVTASADLYDGQTASNVAITEVVGAVMGSETRVAGDGLLAVCQGATAILAGVYERVLVVAHGKVSMGNRWAISNWSFDPIYQQSLGMDDRSAAALHASMLSSDPQLQTSLTPTPIADGAAAVILTRENTPVMVCGMGWAMDEHYLGDRELRDSPALRHAARRAYTLAGITNPKRELSLAEISDHFGYQRSHWASVLGLIGSPQFNLNPSGGLARGVPIFVAGLDRLIEVVLHLGSRPGLGLAHGCWGPAGQGQVVVIVERNRGDEGHD